MRTDFRAFHPAEPISGPWRRSFSLILRDPRSPLLPEGFYAVAIDEVPVLTLHVIPILTISNDHQDYQIVFN